MIRLALILTLMTFVGHSKLPTWRASFTTVFHQRCLKITPNVNSKSEIQSLVCGRALRSSSDRTSWTSLGLIHILVVSGGHLSILANGLVHIIGRAEKRRTRIWVGGILILFCFANQLQPPVLRALFEWLFRPAFLRRSWRSGEIAMISTWFALPFSASNFDLLSLALSFFASVAVETVGKKFHRRPWLALIAVQMAVWWILLPLLFTMGLPHPLTAMTNLILAPLLGATLIPFAMLTWASGALPSISGDVGDPVRMGYLFDLAWNLLSQFIRWLAIALPAASPKVPGTRPLLFGYEISGILMIGLATATCALLIRTRRERRREELRRTLWAPVAIIATGFLLSLFLHRELVDQISGKPATARALFWSK